MNLTWTYAILSFLVIANAVSEDELKTFISLTKYSYEDSCSKTGNVEWAFINKPTNHTRQLWETALCEYAQHKMKQVNETRALTIDSFEDPSLKYAFSMVIQPGDSLLPADDFNKFVSFMSHAELLRLAGYYTTGTRKHFRQDVERQLGRSVKPEDKLASWSAWHQTLAPLEANFSKNLELAEKAALANAKYDVTEYWETLCDTEKGYEKAIDEWSKVSDIYSQILKFVKKRLASKYHIDDNTLPAHLLGSLRGYDWTNIAMDVVPYSETMYSIRKSLWENELVGKNLYREASKLGSVLRHVPQASFWNESEFRGQCPSHLINLCQDGNMRISTCNEASITNYISAHKNVAKILVNQMSSRTDPVLNIANRYSVLEEGVAELFGILSVSPASLISRGLISNTTDLDEARTVSLMITALDVLPRMAYYLTADKWRIDALRNNSLDTSDLASSWWQYRMEYEGVNASVPNLPTFLDDDYITSNRPYLSKFLGTILGFQIYEYLMVYTEVRYDMINIEQPMRHRFAKMILQDVDKNWPNVIKQYLEIEELSVDSLLSYFGPLMDFISENEESDEKPSIPLELERNLDVLQDTYRKKFNAPTTTTTTSTTTTTARPVSSKSSNNGNRLGSPKSAVSEGSSTNATRSKIVEIPPANETKETPIKPEPVPSDGDNPNEEKPKTNTSKAVWAVAAVLVATITICIIAIFGRRRCRKAPKNRRYV